MLELRDIRKRYVTAGFEQVALDGVSVAFRDNEFVAILGPSGSGKTTLLNVVGGLDRFDSGDLLIDGVSTSEYKDRDWDAYRNNRIGFVFQSYNLIPHQTVVANVELALTLSGVSTAERRRRALEALESVGLAEHANKLPSQLSGGQAQRVALARALINDPEILLADEPTGALDSTTSLQVMDLLKEVARDRLVVMVTHNPDLAHRYATRIVELADGRVTADSDPFDPLSVPLRAAKPARRTSMSFLTALSLSLSNLMTKKGRTLLTAFAGSIGIIGIAAVLALANGANDYILRVEEETLSVYPLTISSTGLDITSMMTSAREARGVETGDDDGVARASGEVGETKTITRMFTSASNNDLASLKQFLDAGGDGIGRYVNEIAYTYDVTPLIFDPDTSGGVHQVNPNTSFSQLGIGNVSSSLSSYTMNVDLFSELPGSVDLYAYQYDVVAGRWPEEADELVLVLSRTGTISDLLEYALDLRDWHELDDMVTSFANGEDVTADDDELSFSYDELMGRTFKLVPASSTYVYEEDYDVWTSKADDEEFMASLVEAGEDLRIVGIVRPKEDVDATSLNQGIYYTPALTEHVIEVAAESDVVEDQLSRPEYDVLKGRRFDDPDDASVDLSSLISIDSNAIASAFSLDTSALSLDLSGMDLSGLDVDTSSLQMPSMDDSGLDLSDLDLSGLDLSAVGTPTAEDLAALFPELTAEQLQEILAGVTVGFTEDGQAALTAAMQQVAEGWAAYAAANPSATPADYLAESDVQATLAAAVARAVDVESLEDQLVAAVAETLGTEADADAIAAEVSERLVSYYAEKVAAALAEQIAAAVRQAVQSYLTQVMANYLTQVTQALTAQVQAAVAQAASQLTQNMAGAMGIDEDAFASAFSFDMDEEELASLMSSMLGGGSSTLDANLSELGYADLEKPSEIDIYPIDFDGKTAVIEILDAYNERMAEEDESKVVTYSDMVGAIMGSVTRIIDMITMMLVAFVSISLVVSSIMIGVITYISVLERKKEIGVLRSIGASKHDVSSVFNAETVIEGLVSGLMGVGITALVSLPVNAWVLATYGVERIMQLPWQAAVALVGISVALTFIAGLIPARKAAHADPVEALRSE